MKGRIFESRFSDCDTESQRLPNVDKAIYSDKLNPYLGNAFGLLLLFELNLKKQAITYLPNLISCTVFCLSRKV
jgi:hypothetical protein